MINELEPKLAEEGDDVEIEEVPFKDDEDEEEDEEKSA